MMGYKSPVWNIYGGGGGGPGVVGRTSYPFSLVLQGSGPRVVKLVFKISDPCKSVKWGRVKNY